MEGRFELGKAAMGVSRWALYGGAVLECPGVVVQSRQAKLRKEEERTAFPPHTRSLIACNTTRRLPRVYAYHRDSCCTPLEPLSSPAQVLPSLPLPLNFHLPRRLEYGERPDETLAGRPKVEDTRNVVIRCAPSFPLAFPALPHQPHQASPEQRPFVL